MTKETQLIIDRASKTFEETYSNFASRTTERNILTQNYELGKARGKLEGTLQALYLSNQITKDEYDASMNKIRRMLI